MHVEAVHSMGGCGKVDLEHAVICIQTSQHPEPCFSQASSDLPRTNEADPGDWCSACKMGRATLCEGPPCARAVPRSNEARTCGVTTTDGKRACMLPRNHEDHDFAQRTGHPATPPWPTSDEGDTHTRLTRIVDENLGYRETMPIAKLLEALEFELPVLVKNRNALEEQVLDAQRTDYPRNVDAEFHDAVLEEANDLSQTLGQGRDYHGSGKRSSDWHDGWEVCAKAVESSLRGILAKYEPEVPRAETPRIKPCRKDEPGVCCDCRSCYEARF